MQRVDFLGKEQQRLVALRDPDLSLFSGEEIALVDQVIEYLRGKSAKEVSELSHNRAWWVAKLGGSIPYEAAFISDENPNERDVERGRELVEQHGWASAHTLGLGINAGHDLDLDNLMLFRALPHLDEVSIGHALVSRALFVGLDRSVREYLEVLAE